MSLIAVSKVIQRPLCHQKTSLSAGQELIRLTKYESKKEREKKRERDREYGSRCMNIDDSLCKNAHMYACMHTHISLLLLVDKIYNSKWTFQLQGSFKICSTPLQECPVFQKRHRSNHVTKHYTSFIS